MTATASRARPTTAAPPGPAGRPLLGMAGALRADPLGTLLDGFARYGDVVAYRVGPRRLHRRIVAFHHPDEVRRIFTDVETFTRDTPAFGVLRELIGVSLVTADGDDWQRQKRLLQPLFTRSATDRLTGLIEHEAREAVEDVRARAGGPIDALRLAEQYSLRVLGRVLFAGQGGIGDDVDLALARLIPRTERALVARVRQPLRVPLRWPAPGNRSFAATRDALRTTMERVLARQPLPAGDDDSGLVGKLRAARDPEGERPLSEQEVRDQALLFLLAGYSTTSNALCSALYLLGRHPAVQEQVAAGGDELARAAVQEGLRLYPPSYVLGRRVGPDGAEIAGHALPAGADVLVSPWITHRHPGFWRDPEAFDPWRFVGEDRRAPHAWIPFGAGARACIGRQLALLESTVLLRQLLERCRLESLDAEYPMAQLISMRPSQPVQVACHPR